jgi:hypothetical protein
MDPARPFPAPAAFQVSSLAVADVVWAIDFQQEVEERAGRHEPSIEAAQSLQESCGTGVKSASIAKPEASASKPWGSPISSAR